MAFRTRRALSGGDTWAGFVDALSALLMVLIFALVVFMIAQLFQGAALTGQDQALSRLRARVTELADLLALERGNNADIRNELAQLSAELQQSAASRDETVQAFALLSRERDALLADLAAMQVLALTNEQELEDARARIGLLSEDLDRAREEVTVGRGTLSLKLAELASLQRDLDALEQVRRNLEGEVGRMLLVLEEAQALQAVLENRLVGTEASLAESHASEDELAAALVQNRSELERLALLLEQSRLAGAETEQTLTERISELSSARERIDELIAGLSAARDRSMELEARLLDEEERTLLAQREIEERSIRIAELTQLLGVTEGERASAIELSDAQTTQIALLNIQMTALEDQLASLNDTLEAAEVKAAQDQVQIAELGERLNAALAAKVQELNRFRSEFLERLHDHLGNREDIKVVGDRFVIQSGVLFPSGSAEISEVGREDLRQIADLIVELIAEIPDDVDWILRVDGHTDTNPISTPEFPSNWELSTARATSVVRYLVSLGVPEHRLMAAGFGEFQPIDAAEGILALQRNRRIEFKLTDQ